MERSAAHNEAMRALAAARLAALGLAAQGEGGNFLCFDLPESFEGDGRALADALMAEGVLLRPLAAYGMPRRLRLTLGREAELEAAFAALERALAQGAGSSGGLKEGRS